MCATWYIFDMQTLKLFTVPKMAFKRHAMSSFIRLNGLSIRDLKSRLHLFSNNR